MIGAAQRLLEPTGDSLRRCTQSAPSQDEALHALLVDDSPSSLRNIEHLVRSTSDFTCSGFTDPLEALDAARERKFDLVLVDYMMPGMDGIAFARHLRGMAGYAEVPLVMITSSASASVRLEALDAGATDFLSKTPDATEIKIRLRNVIHLAKALRKLSDDAAQLTRKAEAATRALLEREEEIIFRLSLAVEYRDNDTGGHTLRVALYSRYIAEGLGLSPAVCRSIYLASPLHDVGKVAIPDAILLKPGRLDPDEFDTIKQHSAIGERILGGSNSALIRLAAEIAGAHHERWDGNGYPHGLSGRLIPLSARIVAIADVFDALTSDRPYKTAMPVEEAFAFIERERGRHFDPTCVDAFLAARSRILTVMHQGDDLHFSTSALLAEPPPAL